MDGCIFCKIVKKKVPAQIEYEDGEIIAFDDIAPKAPVHILIIPKIHLGTINDLKNKDIELIGKMILVTQKLAKAKGIDKTGFRLIFNSGKDSGQIVDHLHLHLLGGQSLKNMV